MTKKRLSRGKFEKMSRLATDSGIINALAIDQRGSIVKMLKAGTERNGKVFDMELVYDFKRLVSQQLSAEASAMLIDEEMGFKGIEAKDPATGLIVSYEQTGYNVDTPGRLPKLIENQSAHMMVEKGADALKVLLYFNPNDSDDIQAVKKAFVQRYGTEAAAADIPIFLEIITYDDQIGGSKSREFAAAKPELVLRSIKEFTKPEYHVDVLKLEMPFNPDYVEGMTDAEVEPVYTEAEAKGYLHQMKELVTRPYIFLSAGVPTPVFQKELQLAAEADSGFSGVLSGRATWIEGIDVYLNKGEAGLINWLDTKGKQNVRDLATILEQGAKPWYTVYGGLDNIEVFDVQTVTD
ncbi:tagatose-1,6-bisphosphate aldolase [Secundilactobacillus oryzae JCM 18671]|uniref:Tagatose 1,6-diphosphate aldolase n=1 Tax=Secundilactobacillus oryzae JCM 18671 TaxID=1291743 RepID=A0A081BJ71_9LACO|nr:tagatose 1,6-diphosphate aldolase [Secundilactobacillus oryzae]GAK48089.1 tagatose-1,6-bisphosphate aldolase [Secundilactobacillus oryzae JCM 18671]